MQKIIAPLNPGDKGDAVVNLLEALQALIKYKHLNLDQAEIDKYFDSLIQERADSFYGTATSWLVRNFRIQHSLNKYDYVDDETADVINSILDKEGLLGGGQNGTFTVSGRVLDAKGIVVAGVVVRAYDQDRYREDLLGDAVTDAEGKYNITFSESQFRKTKAEVGGPDVIVRAYSQEDLLLAVSERKTMEGKELTNIDLTIRGEQYFTVKCVIRDGDGNPAKGFYVQIFDRDLRKRQLLGTAKTDANGKSRNDFVRADFQLGDSPLKRGPRLVVEVRKKQKGELLATQEMEMKEQLIVLEFKLPGAAAAVVLSEKERLDDSIMPLLKGQGVAEGNSKAKVDLVPYELNASDIDFIVLETEMDRAAIEAWVDSAKMAQDAILLLSDEYDRQKQILRENGWPFCYGIARQGLSHDLNALLRESSFNWQSAWRTALSLNRVPSLSDEQLKLVVSVLELLQRLQQLDPVKSGNAEFARVLVSAPLPLPKTVALDALSIFNEKGFNDPDALLKLVELHPDSEAQIKPFVRSARVHQLVDGHEALFDNLNGRLEGESDSIAPLAALTTNEWVTLAADTSLSAGLTLQLQAKVEAQHPLTALKARVETRNFHLPGVPESELDILLKDQSDVAESILLGATPVKSNGDNKPPLAHVALRDTGRYVRSGINMEMAAHLMAGGYKTPAAVLKHGRETIVEFISEKYPTNVAEEIVNLSFDHMEKVVEGANGFLIDTAIFARPPAMLVDNFVSDPPAEVRDTLTSIPGLFGDLDECACQACESMLGQSAYLVDLLNQLNKYVWKKDGTSENALNLLRSRRGDILALELSCEKAGKEIQHIDKVLTVLEKAAGPSPYGKAVTAIFPWSLPFDLDYAKTKAYLNKLGVTRLDLLQQRSTTTPDQLTAETAETLGLTVSRTTAAGAVSEWDLITHERSGADLWKAYGFSPDSSGKVTLVDPASGKELKKLPVQDVLMRVSVLLDRTGLNLEEFEQVLHTSFVGKLYLTNCQQCKTSEMRLDVVASQLEASLDRIHRFVRLHAKLQDWTIEELDRAILASSGSTPPALDTPPTLNTLALIKRLHDDGFPLNILIEKPLSSDKFRQTLGLTAQQFALAKSIQGEFVSVEELENFSKDLERIIASGLTVEQAANALLTREKLSELVVTPSPLIKTNEQCLTLLVSLQQRLRSVLVIKSGLTPEEQVIEALTIIFDTLTANRIVNAIRSVGDKEAPVKLLDALFNDLVMILSGTSGAADIYGTWLPVMDKSMAKEILTVDLSGNLQLQDRYQRLLKKIDSRQRERLQVELVSAISEQCGLSASDVSVLLDSGLLLASSAKASDVFLDSSFWADATPGTSIDPKLILWTERLHRLVAFATAVGLERDLVSLGALMVVEDKQGIQWHEVLANDVYNRPNWQALLDMIYLQQPEQLSRSALRELLEGLKGRAVRPETLRPLALRLNFTEAQVMDIIAQVMTVTAQNLQDPGKLRQVFEMLLLARRLGADGAQLKTLSNLADNSQAADTALKLLKAKAADQDWLTFSQKIEDALRQQRRDALVAYLIQNNQHGFRNANDLFEYYLIDPLVEPCLITTELLEATTAVQLFTQKILFGLEPNVTASPELKQRWPWMRNYRVWEANRKVFLFPENWLFSELRDDKSSSFKQLESALGQGELTQDLAQQSYGQFLDDVAQMGQIEVLGMYDDFAHKSDGSALLDDNNFLVRRTLYVIGRTPNQPYAYFWRQCVDFGSPFMEWAPWQRIELDIQGDHVLPFVLGGSLHIAWPVFHRQHEDAKTDQWEVKLAWSRYDGRSWKKSSISREPFKAKVSPFSEERWGFAFRVESGANGAEIFVYMLTDETDAITVKDPTPKDTTVEYSDVFSLFGINNHPIYSSKEIDAIEFLKALVGNKENYNNLPDPLKKQMAIYAKIKESGNQPGFSLGLGGMINPLLFDGRCYIFQFPEVAINQYEAIKNSLPAHVLNEPSSYYRGLFVEEFINDAKKIFNFEYFNYFFNTLEKKATRRTVNCKAWIKLKTPGSTDTFGLLPLKSGDGRFSFKIGMETIVLQTNPDPTRDPYLIGRTDLPWKLGPQPSANCNLTITLNKTPSAGGPITLSCLNSEPLDEVSPGCFATQTLHFIIDGTKHEASDLGFNLEEIRQLTLASKFQLTREDLVKVVEESKTPLINQIGNSRPWMNGYQESSQNLIQPLKMNLQYGSEITIFNPSAITPFWVVGAASSYPHNSWPMVWHYYENGLACYIDIGYKIGLGNSGLFVLPDSYKEATLRRSHWSEFQSMNDPELQNSTFAAKELPSIDRSVDSLDLDEVKVGALAFDARLPYASYNWEVFFHAPLLIADQLSKQHKFEEAEFWLRFVFDPTSGGAGDDPKRSLKFSVFQKMDTHKQVIDDLTALAQAAAGLATNADINAINKLIDRWRDAPFRPFLIARRRHIAFLWRTLFAYLDNLIAWADSLYRRDTFESVNEATMLYVLAERIIGRPPKTNKGCTSNRKFKSYDAMADDLDEFANYWIDLGSRKGSITQFQAGSTIRRSNQSIPNGMLYFCMPFNDKISSYADIVQERLFNVRHCRNIEGIERRLPLIDAEIDPELLVRATAAGLDLSSVLNDLYAPPSHYRYSILSARAAELVSEAKSLGAALLSAIEKKDAEQLAQLRSSNEISLLGLVKEIRTLQIAEAEQNLVALRASRKSVSIKFGQYQRLLGKKDIKIPSEQESLGEDSMLGNNDSGLASNHSGWGLIKEENEQYVGFEGANTWAIASGVSKVASGAAHALSSYWAGNLPVDAPYKVFNGIGNAASAIGDGFSTISQSWRSYAEQQGMMAGHIRRRDEWAFQSNQALRELQQIDKQILANQIRIDITQKELDNHIEQIEQAKAVDEVMRSKFSNDQLYQWMITQLSGLYFNAYNMALKMARSAERAAARELGSKPLNIIGNDYWNSLKNGLLSGERLHQDLRRLEVHYLDQNRREYELTKHISLSQINPVALISLKSTGKCEISLPEILFDMDYPGHYLRRIKSVSLTIPCVTGPYTSVNCTLTLLKSTVRQSNQATKGDYPHRGGDDSRFDDKYGNIQAIVTSSAQNDSGLFEANLRDERYLPFEYAGADSDWRLELPRDFNYFEIDSISDVIIHMRYTAREGGDSLRDSAKEFVKTTLPKQGVQIFDLRRQFASAWHQFVQPVVSSGNQELKLNLQPEMFPFYVRNQDVKVKAVHFFAEIDADKEDTYTLVIKPALPESPTTAETTRTLSCTDRFGDLFFAEYIASGTERGDLGSWSIKIKKEGTVDFRSLQSEEIKNMVMVISFETKASSK